MKVKSTKINKRTQLVAKTCTEKRKHHNMSGPGLESTWQEKTQQTQAHLVSWPTEGPLQEQRAEARLKRQLRIEMDGKLEWIPKDEKA